MGRVAGALPDGLLKLRQRFPNCLGGRRKIPRLTASVVDHRQKSKEREFMSLSSQAFTCHFKIEPRMLELYASIQAATLLQEQWSKCFVYLRLVEWPILKISKSPYIFLRFLTMAHICTHHHQSQPTVPSSYLLCGFGCKPPAGSEALTVGSTATYDTAGFQITRISRRKPPSNQALGSNYEC